MSNNEMEKATQKLQAQLEKLQTKYINSLLSGKSVFQPGKPLTRKQQRQILDNWAWNCFKEDVDAWVAVKEVERNLADECLSEFDFV